MRIQDNNLAVIALAVVCAAALPVRAVPQVGETSVGEQALRELWIGKKIVFLPADSTEEESPYSMWSVSRLKKTPPDAEWITGRIGIIETVKKEDTFDPPYVTVRLGESDTLLYGFAFDNYIPDVGFVEEMEAALKLRGAVLWNNRTTFYMYDSLINKRKPVVVKNLKPLYLWKVEWSSDSARPIRLVLFRMGRRKVFLDGNTSGINPSPERSPLYFENAFHKVNPRFRYPEWKESLWKRIESETIVKQMEVDAVVLSWGEPVEIRRTILNGKPVEVWRYDRDPPTTLTIENGKLISWEITNDEI